MNNRFSKGRFIKCIGIICVLLFMLLNVYWKISKRYTMDFSVSVDNSQKITVRVRGKECDNGRYDYGIDKIDVLNKSKRIQRIVLSDEIPEEDRNLLLNGHTQSPMKDGCFEIVDINFDGAQDFSLMAEGHAGANISHFYFTWNTEKQKYEYAFALTRSSDLKIENEEITVEVQSGYGPPWEITYGYDEDGRLQELVRVEKEIWKEKYVKSIIYKRINGEMVLEGSEIETSFDDGEELSEVECEKVKGWLQKNLSKGEVFGDQYYHYQYYPKKKIIFDDIEFYCVSVRWGIDSEERDIYNTSRVGELILSCDFTEEYSASCKGENTLIIYDYPEEKH